MDNLIIDFLEEASENLGRLDQNLAALRKSHNNKDAALELFRILHMIKGASSFTDISTLDNILQHSESLAEKFTQGNGNDRDLNDLSESTRQIHAIVNNMYEDAKARGLSSQHDYTFRDICESLPAITQTTAETLGKKAELTISGLTCDFTTEQADLIKPVLVQLLRNAVDHGLELPKARMQAGKPDTGEITLKAFRQDGAMTIELSDDGKGLDLARIKHAAIENNVGDIKALNAMGQDALYDLIFEPGLSTADHITTVSGRGIGMDIVRNNLQKADGKISVQSIPGKGCTFIISLPAIAK